MSSSAAGSGRRVRRPVVISGAKLGLGGVRTHLFVLSRLLLERGLEVDLFATGSQWDRSLLDDLRSLGARLHLPPVRLCGAPRLSLIYAGLTWPLSMPRHASSIYCIGAGRSHLWAHRLRSNGAVSINHEIVEPPGQRSLAGTCAATLDVTVANSRKVAEIMRSLWPAKPLRVIPFLTSDRPTVTPAPRPAPIQPLRVIYLGRLVEQKRPDQLAKRWHAMTQHPDLAGATLDIYGYDPEGRMLPDLKQFLAQSGPRSRVRFRGEYDLHDLPRIFESCDLVLLPSLWEGLPLVLVEAMAHGVPFVATDAGGTAELGDHNPDVEITSTNWQDFECGLIRMAGRLRAGRIDSVRLHAWAEERYGFEAVSWQWLRCLVDPRSFFRLQ